MFNKSEVLSILLIITIISISSHFSNLYAQSDTLTYVFLGHTYQGGDPESKRIDFRLEAMDLSRFDRIWLGGDIGSEAGLNYSSLTYLDSIFDLKKPGNHWALGNHDTRNGNIEWIEEITGRPTYYAYSQNSITTIVMNGCISPLDCENINQQYKLIKSVCDTISSGYLIFLIHQGITKGVPGMPDPINFAHQEKKNWLANCNADSNSYAEAIYPLLVDVEARGVEVMHIMGDIGGSLPKSFYGTSSDGIEYFASGIGNGYKILNNLSVWGPDEILIFKHVLATNELLWEFVLLNDL
jgi:hypothetical protein